MARLYYSEYAIENIARRVLTAYDSRLYYGAPSAVPIEALIEANGLSLEYQYLQPMRPYPSSFFTLTVQHVL